MASQPRRVVNDDNGRKPLHDLFVTLPLLTSTKRRANEQWYIVTVHLHITAVCLSTVGSPNDIAARRCRYPARQCTRPIQAARRPRGSDAPPMPIKTRHLAILLGLALTACALGGCASVNA